MIDSKHLQLIVAIEKYGSLNKASKALNLTQSALSHQLKKLEQNLGIQLFLRTDNQLYFTEAGKELREKADSILKEFEALENRMVEIKESQMSRYIHGYSQQEAQRLMDQAQSISDYLHYDSYWEAGSRVLEIGCGVGAQTEIIAQKNPDVHFTSIDIAEQSLTLAKARIQELGIHNVEFRLQDARDIRISKVEQYDHVFICFVLEHLANPMEMLKVVRQLVKKGGTITVIEGDHGSTFFYPDDKYARTLVQAQVDLQQQRGGNANIGRTLYPMLDQAGFNQVEVSPRQIYVDASKPAMVEGFIKNTFTAMIQGMIQELLQSKILSPSVQEKGINGLLRTAEKDGVFSYTFFKGKGTC